ncbi:hypothetical protein [Polycyclovorans algicola]|uniref:hypothetical protein n=1 Tax=Polycyclovorans algicola TaxID=616992 RepID=UPI00126823EC|nr:hypothetical protein [Polycyclovorans algicola]
MSRRGFRRSPLTRQDQPSPETPVVRDNDVTLNKPGNDRRMGCFGWLLSAGVLLGMLVAGVWLAWWVWLHVVINIPIQNQEAGITLPPQFKATARVSNMLDVAMDGEIDASVPFKQTLTVPLRGRYDFDVVMDAKVPVQFEVLYEGVIPVDTSADVTIRTGINYKNLKSLRNLTIETSLPLKFPLPVNLKIPVDDVIDLTYTGHLSADIDQDLLAPVDTVLRTRLPINQTIRTPVTAAIPLDVRLDQKQVRMIITDLQVPLRPSVMLGFGVADDAARDGPVRVDNPYGPLDLQPPQEGGQ